jgi:carboxyl-terminal processing protease
MLYGRSAFENYAQKFAAEGDTRITGTSTGRRNVARDFVVDDAMIADFREQLVADKIKIDEDGFKKDVDFIRAMVRFRIEEVVFGIAEARRHLIAVDPQAQAALTMFGEAQKLTELSRGNKKIAE